MAAPLDALGPHAPALLAAVVVIVLLVRLETSPRHSEGSPHDLQRIPRMAAMACSKQTGRPTCRFPGVTIANRLISGGGVAGAQGRPEALP
jgi:hypothetical protein